MRKKSYRRKRRGGRTRRGRFGRKTIKSVARREISRQIETKVNTGSVNATNATYGGQTWLLTNVVQGDSAFDRIGNEISPTYYRYRCTVSGNPSLTTDNTNFIRMIIVKVTRFVNPLSIATWPGFDEILPGWSGITVPMDSWTLMPAEHPRDFKVLLDRTFNMQQNGGAFRNHYKTGKIKVRKHTPKVKWDASGWIKNALMLYVFSDSNAAPHPTFAFRDRYYYKDA